MKHHVKKLKRVYEHSVETEITVVPSLLLTTSETANGVLSACVRIWLVRDDDCENALLHSLQE